MQGQASFGRRGAPASAARPAPAARAVPDVAEEDFDPEDIPLEDVAPGGIAPKPFAQETERALTPMHWAILAALAVLGVTGTAVIILATASGKA
jgi:hypothetical protein